MGDTKKPLPMKLGDAVTQGIIANQTLAYFIGRTWLFFQRAGIDPARMRFRQHLQHEVGAHGGAHVGWAHLLCPEPRVTWRPSAHMQSAISAAA